MADEFQHQGGSQGKGQPRCAQDARWSGKDRKTVAGRKNAGVSLSLKRARQPADHADPQRMLGHRHGGGSSARRPDHPTQQEVQTCRQQEGPQQDHRRHTVDRNFKAIDARHIIPWISASMY
jgi:hypothetical protein